MTKTKYGHLVRAAAVNPKMLEALGINTTLIRASVFVLGSFLAGLGGALAVEGGDADFLHDLAPVLRGCVPLDGFILVPRLFGKNMQEST